MKTERRHELQTNVLADWLGKRVRVLQPYAKSIIAVCLLVLAGFLAYTVVSGTQSSRLGNAWADYLNAFSQRDADLLDRVADANQGTSAGLWARQSMADIELANGSSQLYQDRDAAAEALDRAAEAYESVRNQAGKYPMLRRRATFGLAQAHEFLSVLTKNDDKIQSHLEQARALYEEIARSSPGTAIAQMADDRLKLLGKLSGGSAEGEGEAGTGDSNWYQWLAKKEMPPPSMGGQGLPGDFGLGGGTPRVGSDTMPSGPPREPLPNIPTLDPPFPLDNDNGATEEKPPEDESQPVPGPDSSDTPPATGSNQPQQTPDEKPAEPTDATESPADAPTKPDSSDAGKADNANADGAAEAKPESEGAEPPAAEGSEKPAAEEAPQPARDEGDKPSSQESQDSDSGDSDGGDSDSGDSDSGDSDSG